MGTDEPEGEGQAMEGSAVGARARPVPSVAEAGSGDPEGPSRATVQRLLVAVAALVAAGLVLVSTSRGIGVTPYDSVAYLTMADEVAAGHMPYPPPATGVPPTHFPPGWSVVVGTLSAVVPSADAMAMARLVNVVFAGLLPVAVYVAVRRRSRPGSWLPVIAAGYVAASYPLFELASRAVTEPMFLTLLVTALLAIERFRSARSTSWLVVAAASVGALTLTRFVGVAALVPLGLAVLTAPTSWRRRAGTACIALLVAVLPTAAWYLLAPGSLATSHLKGDERAGLDQLLLTLEEAGTTIVRGVFLPSAIRYVTGLALLVAPIVAVAIASGAHRSGAESRARRAATYVTSRGLGPWLWFIAAYTGLVLVQRWGINREVIARYWLPYWTVTVVVAGRCIDDVVAGAPRTRRLAIAVLGPLLLVFASYNVAQSAVRARENAQDGITLNAVRYQESAMLGSLADGDVDHVHTDDTYLVEFQTYARGAVIPVDRMSCRVETVDALVARLAQEQAAGGSPAVAIVGRCRAGDFTDALVAALDGASVQHEPGIGTVVVPAG